MMRVQLAINKNTLFQETPMGHIRRWNKWPTGIWFGELWCEAKWWTITSSWNLFWAAKYSRNSPVEEKGETWEKGSFILNFRVRFTWKSGHIHRVTLGSFWRVFTLKTSNDFIIYEHSRTFYCCIALVKKNKRAKEREEFYDVAKLPTCGVKPKPSLSVPQGKKSVMSLELYVRVCMLHV